MLKARGKKAELINGKIREAPRTIESRLQQPDPASQSAGLKACERCRANKKGGSYCRQKMGHTADQPIRAPTISDLPHARMVQRAPQPLSRAPSEELTPRTELAHAMDGHVVMKRPAAVPTPPLSRPPSEALTPRTQLAVSMDNSQRQHLSKSAPGPSVQSVGVNGSTASLPTHKPAINGSAKVKTETLDQEPSQQQSEESSQPTARVQRESVVEEIATAAVESLNSQPASKSAALTSSFLEDDDSDELPAQPKQKINTDTARAGPRTFTQMREVKPEREIEDFYSETRTASARLASRRELHQHQQDALHRAKLAHRAASVAPPDPSQANVGAIPTRDPLEQDEDQQVVEPDSRRRVGIGAHVRVYCSLESAYLDEQTPGMEALYRFLNTRAAKATGRKSRAKNDEW